jgi:hypothetical protein
MEVRMLRNISIALAVVVSLVWVKGASAEMQEGLREITTKVEMKGMPIQKPATTDRLVLKFTRTH